MKTSLRAILANLVDYAGLFPPAKLPMAAATQNYAWYRTDATAWMLGRFICPASRLNELSAFRDTIITSGPPLVVAALGRGGANAVEFETGLAKDLADLAAFRRQHGDQVLIDVLEVKLPTEVMTHPDRLAQLVTAAAGQIEREVSTAITPYFEVPLVGVDAFDLKPILAVLARDSAQAKARTRCRSAGVKYRCGGVEAAAFPTPAQLARALSSAAAAGVAIKCTAGLHHPLPRFDATVNATMHGFINVFLGGILARSHRLSEAALAELLTCTDAREFTFADDHAAWRDHRITPADLRSGRASGMISFGSCSFDEPREDLKALGWLA